MNKWPRAKLGELLRRSEETVDPKPDVEYSQITVRLWGNGVVERDRVLGGSLSSRRFLARHGQFILSRIDARNGALGLVPESLDGGIVTNDFPLFNLNRELLEPSFLGWLSRTAGFVDLCLKASEGTTNRVRLKEDRFLALEIPLPSLAEQRRIVARIEKLAAEVAEARSLRQQGAEEAEALLIAHLGIVFGQLEEKYGLRDFASFSPHVTSGPRNWAKHYEDEGIRFYRAQDIGPSGSVSSDSKIFIKPPPGNQGRSAMLRPGDLMLVITGATVGRVNVFRPGLEPGFVSQHVGICRLPHSEIDPEFARWGLHGPAGQSQVLGQRYGQGKPGLNLGNIRSLSLPFPPLPRQRRIVAELDALQEQVEALKRLQAETSAELEALLPAILDKAFKGEL